MRLKVTSFHLICVILIQIIFLDVILISFFVKEVSKKQGKSLNTAVHSLDGTLKIERARIQGYVAGQVLDTKELQSVKKAKSDNIILKKDVALEMYEKVKIPNSNDEDAKGLSKKVEKSKFIATAYDLSYESCGKFPAHPAYGITYSGKKATRGRTIAVDPEVIPLGSHVYIEFPMEYAKLNGWYVAEDTGSKIKGNIIDVFLGEAAFMEMEKFGSRKVNVTIVQPGQSFGIR